MAFVIEFSPDARDHLRAMRKRDQQIIVDAIAAQLMHQPDQTTQRKPLEDNPVAPWELRVGDYRVVAVHGIELRLPSSHQLESALGRDPVIEQLNPMYRVLASRPAATPEQMREVELHFGHIPPDYRTLIGEVTELELRHYDGQYIRIWGPLGSKDMDEGYGIRARIPDAFPIGDDGGGRVIFYHEGARGPGLYHVGYGNLDSEDAIWMARDLPSLLGEGSGIDGF